MRTLILAGVLLALTSAPVLGDVPGVLNYQGMLRDTGGAPVADSNYVVTFALFNTASGGTSSWSELQTVATSGGLFNIELGSVVPIPDQALADSATYLEMTVGSGGPLSPRIRFSAAPYSRVAHQMHGDLITQPGNIQVPPDNATAGSAQITLTNLDSTGSGGSSTAGIKIEGGVSLGVPVEVTTGISAGTASTALRADDGSATASRTDVVTPGQTTAQTEVDGRDFLVWQRGSGAAADTAFVEEFEYISGTDAKHARVRKTMQDLKMLSSDVEYEESAWISDGGNTTETKDKATPLLFESLCENHSSSGDSAQLHVTIASDQTTASAEVDAGDYLTWQRTLSDTSGFQWLAEHTEAGSHKVADITLKRGVTAAAISTLRTLVSTQTMHHEAKTDTGGSSTSMYHINSTSGDSSGVELSAAAGMASSQMQSIVGTDTGTVTVSALGSSLHQTFECVAESVHTTSTTSTSSSGGTHELGHQLGSSTSSASTQTDALGARAVLESTDGLVARVTHSTSTTKGKFETIADQVTDAIPGGGPLLDSSRIVALMDSLHVLNAILVNGDSAATTSASSDKRKQSLYFPESMLEAIQLLVDGGASSITLTMQNGTSGVDTNLILDNSGNATMAGELKVGGNNGMLASAQSFTVPRVTTSQRDTLTPVNGMIIYNTTTNQFNFHENNAWVTK